MTTLKPCPFCGGQPDLANSDAFRYVHSCAGIRITTEWFSSLDEARKAWNRRGDGWKPASEVPKHSRWVLAVPKYHSLPEIAHWSANDENWYRQDGTSFNATHWRELPELPKEDK